jgi:uncharacterized protein YerC
LITINKYAIERKDDELEVVKMANEFKITIEVTTKEDFSIADIQRYYRNLCHTNGDLKAYTIKTEVKEK